MGRLARRTLMQAALATASGASVAEAAETAVVIDNFAFVPAELIVAAGTTVTWTNRDDIPHLVLGASGAARLRSPPLDTDDRFSFVFSAPGVVRYYCALHPHMQGRVVVV